MVCGLVQTFDNFHSHGCPNCEEFLAMKGSNDRVLDSTSSTFSGLIGMIQPKGSWVARWQNIGGKERGLYAVKVMGRLAEDVRDICDSRGIRPITNEQR